MNQEKIKAFVKLLDGMKYYEWQKLAHIVERKYDSESQRTVIQDSESLEKGLLLEFDLLGNNLN